MNFRKLSLLFGAAILHALNLVAQTTQGPTLIPQLNTDFFVGTVPGFNSSIQSAVTQLCAISSGPAANGSRVIIPAGSSVDGTPGFTISAVIGGCTKVAIEDRRATPAGAYLWNGSAYTLQGSGGGCTTGCVLTNPSTDQTINQPGQTTLNFNSTWTTVSPANGAGTTQSLPVQITQNVDGASKNFGNPGGFAGAGDSLWRVMHPFFITGNWFAGGIGEGLHIDLNAHKTGDVSGLRIGESGVGAIAGGAIDVSGEGVTPIIVDGTQQTDYFRGTVTTTTGTGDTAPVIAYASGFASMIGDGWIVDASKPIVSGTLNGLSVLWNTVSSSGASLGLLPTSTVNTPSDGICVTTTYLQAGPALQAPFSQTGSCTVSGGLALPVGAGPFRVMIGSFSPEPGVLTNVSAVSGGVQTFTLLAIRPHEVGSYIIHGGTQGVNIFANDLSMANDPTEIIVLGATDSTHEIIEMRNMSGAGIPYLGAMAETTTSAFTVYPGTAIASLMRDGVTATLSENLIPFTVGDTVWSFPPLSYLENGYTIFSTQTSPDNPSRNGAGYVATSAGIGWNGSHPAFRFNNFSPASHYIQRGGWLSPPPILVADGNTGGGVVGNWIMAPTPDDGGVVCTTGTYLCDVNATRPTIPKMLFQCDCDSGTPIIMDYPNERWLTQDPWISKAQLGVGDGTFGILQDSVNVRPVIISPGFANAFGLTVNYNGNTSPLPLAIGKWRYNIDAFSGPGVYCWYETTDVTDTVAYKACSDGSGNEFHQFIGPVSMTSASVLASTTANDLAYFDTATGHLADSGILKENLALLNAANAFTMAQNLPTGSQVNSSLICTVNGTNCPAPAGIPTFGTPASSTAACTVPQVEYDASFLYTCVATNSWTRVATTTF